MRVSRAFAHDADRETSRQWRGPLLHPLPAAAGYARQPLGLRERHDRCEAGGSIRGSVEEGLAGYAGQYENVQTIIRQTPPEGLLKWALFDREPLARWSVGRIALPGDAVHPMLRFLGQPVAVAA